MNIDERLEQIRKKLKIARRKRCKPFGYGSHKWKLNPAIKETELIRIEKFFSVSLPSEYREFILKIGDGGAGPYYGLYSLQQGINHYHKDSTETVLKKEFPHVNAYNPDEDPYLINLEKMLEKGEITESSLHKIYDEIYQGTFAVNHEGCGYMNFLVVSGHTRGQIWHDAECTDQGFKPSGMSFLDWYEEWLDKTLETHSSELKLILRMRWFLLSAT